MEKFEIWRGPFCADRQAGAWDDKPEKMGEETAINFKVACLKMELKHMLASIEKQERSGYVQEASCHWAYNFYNNTNSWTGKYFEFDPSKNQPMSGPSQQQL